MMHTAAGKVYSAVGNEWLVTDGAGKTKLQPDDYALGQNIPLKACLVPSGPYEDLYAYQETGLSTAAGQVSYELLVEFCSTDDLNAAEAFEFEIQVQTANKLYNGGVQANFTSGVWRVFNFLVGTWVATTIKLPTKAQWLAGVSIKVNYMLGATSITFVSMVVDNVEHVIGITFPTAKPTKQSEFNCAFQLDGSAAATPVCVYLHEATVTVEA